MERNYIEDQTYEREDFAQTKLTGSDYDSCSFANCNFLNANLSDISFFSCKFTGCNMSMAKLAKTTFRDVVFTDCKLLGLQFADCNDFLLTVRFDSCQLNLSSFYQRKLKGTVFKNSNLQEADFSGADLTGADFSHCDLSKAIFENCNLEKADFRTAANYSIDPEKNRIRKAKFSMPGVSGLLDKYDIKIE